MIPKFEIKINDILIDNLDDVSGYIWYNQDVADIDEIGVNIRID
jgi:hypothetical protein